MINNYQRLISKMKRLLWDGKYVSEQVIYDCSILHITDDAHSFEKADNW